MDHQQLLFELEPRLVWTLARQFARFVSRLCKLPLAVCRCCNWISKRANLTTMINASLTTCFKKEFLSWSRRSHIIIMIELTRRSRGQAVLWRQHLLILSGSLIMMQLAGSLARISSEIANARKSLASLKMASFIGREHTDSRRVPGRVRMLVCFQRR